MPTPEAGWTMVRESEAGALLSIRAKDGAVWAVGGDPDGVDGPLPGTLLVDDDPTDEDDFISYDTALQGDFWWVDPVSAEVAYFGGSYGRVARVDISSGAAVVEELTTPASGQGDDTVIVFGVLAVGDDVWAAGGRLGGLADGFLWRSQQGGALEAVTLPTAATNYVLWKAAARTPDDVWFVGTKGLTFHWDGATMTELAVDEGASLFTVALDDEGAVAVGGPNAGRIISRGLDDDAPWQDTTPATELLPALFGVHLRGGDGMIVGQSGMLLTRKDGVFSPEQFPFNMFVTLHSCFLGDDGYAWAVGGSISGLPLTGGVLLRRSP
ncbi:MAG: hypothetical protein HYS27_06360 [Deltaproteobacteria bacterium]|nr:hypothetical protein [Deltaproteobacteria bacterium]